MLISVQKEKWTLSDWRLFDTRPMRQLCFDSTAYALQCGVEGDETALDSKKFELSHPF